MCGLAGIIIGQSKRSQSELDRITDMFTNLLLHSQHRGPFATGAASIGSDGQLSVLKLPVPAYKFVDSEEYRAWMKTINTKTTYLMGHTRWPTKGSIYNLDNNHPLIAPVGGGGHVLVTHNGSISHSDFHFRRLGLLRTAQVDSELLLRIAQRHSGEYGLDIDRFIDYLTELHGRMSLAAVATSRPSEIILLKGNMPLEVKYNPKYKIIAYASELGNLDYVLKDSYWEYISVISGEGLVLDTNELSDIRRTYFKFSGIEIKYTP